MSAVLFGSISTLADTSELQRQAFNQSFEEHALGWNWKRADYISLLETSGGRDRVAAYARSHNQAVDSAAVHSTKSKIFQESLGAPGLRPRPGVVETIAAARDHGMKLALVTTTSPDNVAALLAALGPQVQADHFDLVVDATSVETPKPHPAAYRYTLATLGESAQDCVAIEDNLGGVRAAIGASVTCVAFPNSNTAGHNFCRADVRVDELDFAALSLLGVSSAVA